MIEPTKQDIGRKVYYKKEWTNGYGCGIITSFNDTYVYVDHGIDIGIIPALRGNFFWIESEVN